VSAGRSRLILHSFEKIPKKNIFQSIFQKVRKNYPSNGWSRRVHSLVPLAMADHSLAGSDARLFCKDKQVIQKQAKNR